MHGGWDDLAAWQSRLRQAQNDDAVVALVNDVVAGLSGRQMSLIPEIIRPPVLADAAEVASFNVELLRYELLFRGEAEVAALLSTLVVVLTEASARLSVLSLEARLTRPR